MDVEIVVYSPSGRGVFGTAGTAFATAAAAFTGALAGAFAGAFAGALTAGGWAHNPRLRRATLKTDMEVLMMSA